jgi:hypothetical protein
LEKTLSARELREWEIWTRDHPLPDSWYQAGIVASTIFNAMTSGRRLTPEDFIPSAEPPAEQTADEAHAAFLSIATSHNLRAE